MSTAEELLGRKSSGSVVLTTQRPLSAKIGTSFADKLLGWYCSLADYGREGYEAVAFAMYGIN
jgi:hypothetical protein